MIRDQLGRVGTLVRRFSGRPLDALDFLRLEHMKVQALFLQVRATRDVARQERLWKRIRKALEAHTLIEESVFYPACEAHEKLKPLVLESLEEHRQVTALLKSIEALSKDSEKFQPKLYLLMENVEHHVREEENLLFPKVRRFMDYQELEELGAEMRGARKGRKAAA
jgi:hemerythrin superfamily protein